MKIKSQKYFKLSGEIFDRKTSQNISNQNFQSVKHARAKSSRCLLLNIKSQSAFIFRF
jgi:hypothetical protein